MASSSGFLAAGECFFFSLTSNLILFFSMIQLNLMFCFSSSSNSIITWRVLYLLYVGHLLSYFFSGWVEWHLSVTSHTTCLYCLRKRLSYTHGRNNQWPTKQLQSLFTFVSRNNIHPWTLPFLLPLAHILLTGKALFPFDPAEGNWLEGIFVIS